MKEHITLRKYTKSNVKRAGKILSNPERRSNPADFNWAMDVLSWWRYQHEQPLEKAYKLLQKVAAKKQPDSILAKRLKREESITKKLSRFPDMMLTNMQDIGGCRVILSTVKKVDKINRELRKCKEFKDANGRVKVNDYITNPKPDGYRGYHLKGSFPGSEDQSFRIEIQVRTKLQHSWATALEIVDLFTGQALKSNDGDKQWQEFFKLVSQQFAVMEKISRFDQISNELKFAKYSETIIRDSSALSDCGECQRLSKSLDVMNKFNAYANSLVMADKHIKASRIEGFVLVDVTIDNLDNRKKGTVRTTIFSEDESAQAENEYIKREKEASEQNKGSLVALVSSTAVGGIKEAYPNFFADTTLFMQHLVFINGIQNYKLRDKFIKMLWPFNQS
ncbi:RelA/SpoT domain-containing protein [Gynuella sp.]|uniref:RelA/SpoT domain-containing protein n=1 Tax=Gynuella sp. TaxID=2969146 RepID=UPI003D132023